MSGALILQLLVAAGAAATLAMLVSVLAYGEKGEKDGETVFDRIPAFREYGTFFNLPPTLAAATLLVLLVLVFLFLATLQGGGFAFWGVVFIAAGLSVFSHFLKDINKARYLKKFEDQLPMVADQLVSTVRGGKTLTQGLAILPGQLPEPAASEIGELSERARLGAGGLEEAIEAAAAKYDSKHLALLLSVFGIFARQGGNIVEPMQKMSTSFKDIWRAEQAIKTAGASAKASFWMINIAVLFIFAFLSLAAPNLLSQVFATPVTAIFFFVGIGVYVLGAYLMRAMMKVEI